MEPGEFQGVAGRTLEDSTPWWPDLPSAPEGAPNVVVVLLDDVGYAQFGCYGSTISTPTFDRLGCERAPVLQLPHHRAVLADACVPAHGPQPPPQRDGTNRRVRVGLPRLRRDDAEGERDDARDPRAQRLRDVRGGQVASRARAARWWPADRGSVGHSVGGSSGSTGSSAERPTSTTPTSCTTTTKSTRRARPRRATTSPRTWSTWRRLYLSDLRAASPTKPFLLWFAPGACHAPHQVPRPWIERYEGAFDHGWDAWPRGGVREAGGDRPAPGGHRAERAAAVDRSMGLAHRRRAPPLRADDGGVRRLPRAHRRAGRASARLHRGAGRERQHRSSW